MAETCLTSGFDPTATDDTDGAADDDPGPSFFYIMIEFNGWRAIEGVEQAVRRAYDATVEKLGVIDGREVCVLLSSDAAVAALNAQYRGIEKPTNVLSFPSLDAAAGQSPANYPQPLGDIVIACETVMREVAAEGKPALSHLAHLTVHGLLHLAGFDHETDYDAEPMESLEREILASIGVSDPYSLTIGSLTTGEAPALTGK
jgi:probable rRNA maturation factor